MGSHSRCSWPASAMESVNRPSTMRVSFLNSSSKTCRAFWYSSAVRGLESSNSVSPCKTAIGVRSSWEASVTNWRNCRTAESTPCNKWLNVSARRPNSSWGEETGSGVQKPCRLVTRLAIKPACWVSAVMGLRLRPTKKAEIPAVSNKLSGRRSSATFLKLCSAPVVPKIGMATTKKRCW